MYIKRAIHYCHTNCSTTSCFELIHIIHAGNKSATQHSHSHPHHGHAHSWNPNPLMLFRAEGKTLADPQWVDMGNPTHDGRSFNTQPTYVVSAIGGPDAYVAHTRALNRSDEHACLHTDETNVHKESTHTHPLSCTHTTMTMSAYTCLCLNLCLGVFHIRTTEHQSTTTLRDRQARQVVLHLHERQLGAWGTARCVTLAVSSDIIG